MTRENPRVREAVIPLINVRPHFCCLARSSVAAARLNVCKKEGTVCAVTWNAFPMREVDSTGGRSSEGKADKSGGHVPKPLSKGLTHVTHVSVDQDAPSESDDTDGVE